MKYLIAVIFSLAFASISQAARLWQFDVCQELSASLNQETDQVYTAEDNFISASEGCKSTSNPDKCEHKAKRKYEKAQKNYERAQSDYLAHCN
jgi:hypothetical protein